MNNEELNARLSGLEKRIDDQKQFLGFITGVAAILISALSIVFAWNLSGERESLRYFKSELKEEVRIELKKITKKPLLTILDVDGRPLSDRTIPATFTHYEEYKCILAPIIFKNIGDSSSGDISFKAYTKKSIVLRDISTDEKDYMYEATYFPGKSGIDKMPGGGFSSVYDFRLYPKDGVMPKPGKHPVLIKVYYGEGEVKSVEFTINVQ